MPLGIAFITYPCFKSDFGYLERPRSTGSGSDLKMHRVGTAFTMKMNSDDKICCGNVV